MGWEWWRMSLELVVRAFVDAWLNFPLAVYAEMNVTKMTFPVRVDKRGEDEKKGCEDLPSWPSL
jgi:hypothetical protein